MEKLINFAKRIYLKIPLPILNFAAPLFWCIPPRKRFGKSFINTWEMLEREQKHTPQEFDELVNSKFRDIIAYSYLHVPYYRECMEKEGLVPEDFKNIQDLRRLPFLSKNHVLNNQQKLIAQCTDPNNYTSKYTSGSTGTPVEFLFDRGTALREWANVLHLWKRVGYQWNSGRVVLRGAEYRTQKKGKLYQWDAMRKELSLNIHDMSDENCALFCQLIEKYKLDFLHGYPSAVFQLCNYIKKCPINHQFKAVLLASETVTDTVRFFIEEVLHTRVYSFYGHTERAVIAGECEKYHHYHVEPTYGYVELIDENGMVIEDDRPGEIVVTGFTNYVMPLIRYKTGDIGQWDLSAKCDCGYYHKILKTVKGRMADFVYDCDGVLQNITGIRYTLFSKYNVVQFQFEQNVIGVVDLYVVVNDLFSENDKLGILKLLREDSTDKLRFNIKPVDRIKLGKNGKARLVIQNCIGIDLENE